MDAVVESNSCGEMQLSASEANDGGDVEPMDVDDGTHCVNRERNDEVEHGSLVRCDSCESWFHSLCAGYEI